MTNLLLPLLIPQSSLHHHQTQWTSSNLALSKLCLPRPSTRFSMESNGRLTLSHDRYTSLTVMTLYSTDPVHSVYSSHLTDSSTISSSHSTHMYITKITHIITSKNIHISHPVPHHISPTIYISIIEFILTSPYHYKFRRCSDRNIARTA